MPTDTTPSARHVWRIDDLPEIETLSVTDCFDLWTLLDAEFTYRLALDGSNESSSALGAQYAPAMTRIEQAIAQTKAVDGLEVAFKIDLFTKVCEANEPGEDDWEILRSARDNAVDLLRGAAMRKAAAAEG